jgi:FKBP-type peptidyl-prolyl cis-trans isomerase
MRAALAFMAVLALAMPAQARQDEPPQPQPPITLHSPQPVPVPDGPVVQKTELEGGLVLEDLALGEGREIKDDSIFVAYYHGTLKDGGTVFDSSFNRGEAAPLSLANLIPAWQKGLPGMKVGGVRRLTVPSAMAYGERGAGNGVIPPNADLVFVIQVTDILHFEDTKVGEGEEIHGPCVALTTHVINDAEGKELARADAAHPYIWIPGEMNPPSTQFDAMQSALSRMKVGGKRRVHIPKEMNVNPPGLPTTRPVGIPLDFEIELIAVRNLQERP